MKSLILAIQFLTRVPINIQIETKDDSFAHSVLWFPVVGVIIGVFNALIYFLFAKVLDGMLPIVCAVLANVCITGALHLDGLADTCDGVFSARKRDRMLEIMKDSRIGTNGAIAVVFDILMRLAILLSVSSDKVIWLIFAAPVASRALMPLLMKLSVYARAEGGMGGLFLGKQSWSRTLIAFVVGMMIVWLSLNFLGLAAFAVAMLVILIYRSYIYSKIQGMTGDTIGAGNEIAEIVFLLAAVIIWRQLL